MMFHFELHNKTKLYVPSTKCLCNLNICKPNTCLNWTNSAVPRGWFRQVWLLEFIRGLHFLKEIDIYAKCFVYIKDHVKKTLRKLKKNTIILVKTKTWCFILNYIIKLSYIVYMNEKNVAQPNKMTDAIYW
jgi:hypothetical protein